MPTTYTAASASFTHSKGPIQISDDDRYLKLLSSEPGYALGAIHLDPASSYHRLAVQLNLAKAPACTIGLTSNPDWLNSSDQKANTIMLRTAYGYVHINQKNPSEQRLEIPKLTSVIELYIHQDKGKAYIRIGTE